MNGPSTYQFTFATHASQGKRARQEDYADVWQPANTSGEPPAKPALIVVADGMGGHVSGQIASRLACEAFIKSFTQEDDEVGPRMASALFESNQSIADAISNDKKLDGMGCTIIAGYLSEDVIRWASVGDSALLLYRQGKLLRLNADHSHGALLDKQVEAGIITAETASKDKRRRALHSALTGSPIPLQDLELHGYPLQHDDCLILSTDGLFTLTGNEIASLVHKNASANPSELAGILVNAVDAQQHPQQDNTTLTVVRVQKNQ